MVPGAIFVDSPLGVSWPLTVLIVIAVSAFCVFAAIKSVQAHRPKPATGGEGLLGEKGKAVSAIAPEGKVFIHGEYWEAWSDEPLAEGDKVTVIAVEDDMRVKVKKAGR